VFRLLADDNFNEHILRGVSLPRPDLDIVFGLRDIKSRVVCFISCVPNVTDARGPVAAAAPRSGTP